VEGAYRERTETNEGRKEKSQTVISRPIFVGMVAAALIVSYAVNGTAVAASYSAFWGHDNLIIQKDVTAALPEFHDAIGWSPYQWDLVRDYAQTVAQQYFFDRTSVPRAEIVMLVHAMESVAQEEPMNAYNHYLLTNIYNLVSDVDPEHYLPAAEKEAAAAFALSPDRQEIYYFLAKTKDLEGDVKGALALAKKALDLDPKIADSHFYYGMLAFANGDATTGYAEVKLAMSMGRSWHDFYEPRVAADYFADAGHVPDAIDLYKIALTIEPTDLESEIKLGAAYFLEGKSDLARHYLSDAASRFDFSQSPVYGQYKPILDVLHIPTGKAAPQP
jgi:tetratricopeptide (TPR) repeat protein